MKKRFVVLLAFMLLCCAGAVFSACNNKQEEPTETVKAVSILGAKDYTITESVSDFSFVQLATGVLSDENTTQVQPDTSKVVLGKAGEYEIVYTFSAGGETITETKKVLIYGQPVLTAEETTIYYSEAGDFDVRTMATAEDSFGKALDVEVESDGGFAADRYVYATYTVAFTVTDAAGQTKESSAELHVVREPEKEPVIREYSFDPSSNELVLYADLKGQELFCVETSDGYVFPENQISYDADQAELRMSAAAFESMTESELSLVVRSTHGYTSAAVDFSKSPVSIETLGLRFTREKGKVSLPEIDIRAFGNYESTLTLISASGDETDITESVPQEMDEGVYDLKIDVVNVYGADASLTVQLNIVSSEEYAALIDDGGSLENEKLYKNENYVGSVFKYTDEELDGVSGVYKVIPVLDSENASQVIWEPFVSDLTKYRWFAFDVCVSDATDAATIQFLSEFYMLTLRDGAKMPFTAGKWTTLSIDLQFLKDYNSAGLVTDTNGFSLLTKNHSKPYYIKNVRWVEAEAGLRSSFEGSWEVVNELYVPLGNEGIGVTAEINQDPQFVTHGEKSLKLTSLGSESGYNFVVNHAAWFSTTGYTHFAVDVQLVVPEGTENAVTVIYTGVTPWFYNSGTALEIRPGTWYTVEIAIPAGSTYIQICDAAQPVGGGGLGAGWSLYLDNLRCVNHS